MKDDIKRMGKVARQWDNLIKSLRELPEDQRAMLAGNMIAELQVIVDDPDPQP